MIRAGALAALIATIGITPASAQVARPSGQRDPGVRTVVIGRAPPVVYPAAVYPARPVYRATCGRAERHLVERVPHRGRGWWKRTRIPAGNRLYGWSVLLQRMDAAARRDASHSVCTRWAIPMETGGHYDRSGKGRLAYPAPPRCWITPIRVSLLSSSAPASQVGALGFPPPAACTPQCTRSTLSTNHSQPGVLAILIRRGPGEVLEPPPERPQVEAHALRRLGAAQAQVAGAGGQVEDVPPLATRRGRRAN